MAIDDVLYDVSFQHVDAQQKLKHAVVLAANARNLTSSLDSAQALRLSTMAMSPASTIVDADECNLRLPLPRKTTITSVTDTPAVFFHGYLSSPVNSDPYYLKRFRSRQVGVHSSNAPLQSPTMTSAALELASSQNTRLEATVKSTGPTAETAMSAVVQAARARAIYNHAAAHVPLRYRVGKTERKMFVSSPLRKMLATRFVTEKIQQGIQLSCRMA
ncbi:hypothetical protein Cpir12675_004852 [Ceratocystis pirilliformis]|uniref:Uncharacterized protein n=1 Tax=Ceratocystis pirilliformis TaxID=259994 RepID=A0ABR3YTI9_9PEZI